MESRGQYYASQRVLLTMLLGLVVSALRPSVYAEPSSSETAFPLSGASIIIVARTLDESIDPTLLGIIELAASLKFNRLGCTSRVLVQTNAADFPPLETIFTGNSFEAEYLLLAEVSLRGRELALRLAWFNAEAAQWTAELERNGRLDVGFDSFLFNAVDDLLIAAQAAGSPGGVVRPIEEARTGTPLPVLRFVSAEALIAAYLDGRLNDENMTEAVVPPSIGNEGPTDYQNPEKLQLAVQPMAEQTIIEKPLTLNSGLQFGLVAGGFLAGGALGSFFEAAGGLGTHFLWFFPQPDGFLAAGVDVSATIFQASGPLQSGFGLFLPLAAEIRIGLGLKDFWPYARLASGAALFYLKTEFYDDKVTIIPCATAGLGFVRYFSNSLGLSVDLSYLVAFDGQDPIMGLTPKFGLVLPIRRQP